MRHREGMSPVEKSKTKEKGQKEKQKKNHIIQKDKKTLTETCTCTIKNMATEKRRLHPKYGYGRNVQNIHSYNFEKYKRTERP